MTIDQAIKLADTLQPNPYPRDMKLRWLAMLDGRIFNENTSDVLLQDDSIKKAYLGL